MIHRSTAPVSTEPLVPGLGPCGSCRYYVKPGPALLHDLPIDLPPHRGQCRRSSPRMGHWVNRWPVVDQREGCGEYKPREQEAQDGVPDHHG